MPRSCLDQPFNHNAVVVVFGKELLQNKCAIFDLSLHYKLLDQGEGM